MNHPLSTRHIRHDWPIYAGQLVRQIYHVYNTSRIDEERVRDFLLQVSDRLAAGEEAYGDASFKRALSDLLGEKAQEALDLIGWGSIIYHKLPPALQREALRIDAEAFLLWARMREFAKLMK